MERNIKLNLRGKQKVLKLVGYIIEIMHIAIETVYIFPYTRLINVARKLFSHN